MMTNGTLGAVKQAAVAVSAGDLEGARENVERAAKRATRELQKAGKAVNTLALERPLVTAGALLGVGALAGAVVVKLLSPRPSAGEVLFNALKRGSAQAGDSLISSLRHALH